MPITGTHIAYLHTCHRKLWLFANGIQMEHTSQIVAEGKLIAETTYLDRARKYTELEMEGIKIDFYDAKNKVIHEVKKSDKVEHAHFAQVKYYLYILLKNGIPGASAIVEWEEDDKVKIEEWISSCSTIIHDEQCPPLLKKPICKKCSYHDFCYSGEE